MSHAHEPGGRRPETAPAHAVADVYRSFFEHAVSAIAFHEIVLDARGRPIDYVFLEVNAAFERQLGLRRESIVGRRVTEVFPGIERDPADWIGRFGRIALTGEPERFQHFSAPLRRRYDVAAFSPAMGYFAVMLSDVTDDDRLEQALREADRKEAERLGFLSRGLRNPLAPLQDAVWLLDRAEPHGEQASRAKRIIQRQVAQLGRLVDDLFEATCVARGKLDLQKARIDLVDLVRATVEDYRQVFGERDIGVVQQLGGSPVWIDADATRISRAVGNLLHNAAKFSRRGGRVEVEVAREPQGSALIRVRDEGVGIAPDMLDTVFEPFTQGDHGLGASPGLGLGLALVKAFVELHGGSVDAGSGGAGRGAEFLVRLPAAPEEPAMQARPRGAVATAPRRVLVVEDHLDAAETLREVLAMWGHQVEVAYDGRSGVDKARAFRPDVVLCDVGLPVMDGYEVARAIRADPALASALLVAVTGYSAPEDRRRSAEAGFDRHLGKPVSVDVIEEVISASRRA